MIKQISAFLMVLTLAACMQTNEVTGRKQFIIIPPSQDAAMGVQALAEVRKSTKVMAPGRMTNRISQIGRRIAARSDAPNMDWEFIVIDEPVLNAWALPGGKVAIYRKMVDSFSSDAEIAAILGHEIAHAVLRHGAEQVSRAQVQQLVVVGAGMAAGAAAGAGAEDQKTAELATQLAGLAAQGFVALPHSRSMELEADDIGTLYMAQAGYDPRAAVRLWQQMKQMKEGSEKPPTWLSTHPGDDKRISRLNAKMDVYMTAYKAGR